MKKFILLISCLLFHINDTTASDIYGIRGPIYLNSGWNLTKGDLAFYGHSRFYFKNDVTRISGQPINAVTFWDAQGSFTILYGIGKYSEIGLSQIVYQDNHSDGKGYNLPDDLYLRLKFASFGPEKIPFDFGVQIASRFPVAKYHNVPLEPYSAGKVEFIFIGLLSYSPNLLKPEDSFNAHVNLGFLDHNDVGVTKTTSSKEFIYGTGIVYPIYSFDFSLECYGNRHLSRPPENAYSRYNYVYVTPGITYRPFYWLSTTFGFDYRLTAAKPNASAHTISGNTPVFPTWRVNLGIKVNLMSRIQKRYEDKNKSDELKNNQEKTVYEQIEDEQKKIKNAEQELESLVEERKRMDDMLNRLRSILESKPDDSKKDR